MPKTSLPPRRSARSSTAAPAPAQFIVDAAAAAGTGRRAVAFGCGRTLLLDAARPQLVARLVSFFREGAL